MPMIDKEEMYYRLRKRLDLEALLFFKFIERSDVKTS